MKKKMSPLTMKKAKEVAVKVFGTSRGLKKDARFEGAPYSVYQIPMGDFRAEIRYDIYGGTLIQVSMRGPVGTSFALYDPNTLEENYHEEECWKRREQQEAFDEWVGSNGPELCHVAVDKSWNNQR